MSTAGDVLGINTVHQHPQTVEISYRPHAKCSQGLLVTSLIRFIRLLE